MPFADLARHQAATYLGLQLEQAGGVRDRRAAAPHPLGHVLLREPVLAQQAAVGERLLDRVQVGTLDVLDERQLQQLRAVHLTHDHRHGGQVGEARRLQTALARDEAVAALLFQAHHQRLQDAVLADRFRQLAQLLGLEVGPGLLRVRRNQIDIDLLQRSPGGRLFAAAGQEGVEPPAESSSWLRHALTSTRSVSSTASLR